MRILYRLFSSPVLALVLLITFAVAMATATFIENDFGTDTAWIQVYDALWFELVMIGLGLCFLASTFKYNLWRKEKWAVLLFHLAFILIIIGAGITRYSSYGGIMRIREGQTTNSIISDKNYLQAHISDANSAIHLKRKLEFSPLNKNDFAISTDLDNIPITISYNNFVADAIPEIVEDKQNGKPLLQMMVTSDNGRETLFLEDGEIEQIGSHKHKIGFNVGDQAEVNILEKDGKFYIQGSGVIDFFVMADSSAGILKPDTLHTMGLGNLYRFHDISFVPSHFHEHGKIVLKSDSDKPKDNDPAKDDALVLNIQVKDKTEEVMLLYRKNFLPSIHEVEIEGVKVSLSYGALPIEIPFALHLREFQLDRYPGSNSPASYASEVTILDGEKEIPFRIWMNNVLDYGGFRFYQASYDTDEKGTLLAVNHDVLGTNITYIGYLLMTIGMFFTFFGKGTRFSVINRSLKKLKQRTSVIALFLMGCLGAMAQTNATPSIPDIIAHQEIDRTHADLFGRIMVQDVDGRIKPLNTLASELVRKIHGRDNFKYKDAQRRVHLNTNQTFLAMHTSPGAWQRIPVIKIDPKKGGDFFKTLNITPDGYISFNDLIEADGNYKLTEKVADANTRKPAEHNEFDKEILKVDEGFNILFNILSGNYLKVFPNSLDSNDTWFSYNHHFQDFPEEDARFAQSIMPTYFQDLMMGDLEEATEKLSYIDTFQRILGKDIMPSDKRIEAELWYNQMNLNFWLFVALFAIGFVLLVLAMTKIFTQNKFLEILWNAMVVLSLICFLLFTGNILLRWFVAGYPPWTNGYEMMVFVSWTLLLCGLVSFRKSDFALALASLFSGALLFVSYLDWLNPEITNLMPVLRSSFWLKVHVATILSSYAPLALSAIIGLMVLILMIIRTDKTKRAIDTRIKELSYINEIAMTIGVFILAIGTFLGGVWANESWGRYWAWDPKETWALISVIIYTIVLHLRLVPALNTRYALNMTSVFAFGSIIMTSYGVNYYLSGLHSYASGDPVPIPSFVYVLLVVVVLISVLAYFRNRKVKIRIE